MNIGTRFTLLCSLPLLLNACAGGQLPQKKEELAWKRGMEQRLDALSAAMPATTEREDTLARLEARMSLLETDNKREYQDAQNRLAAVGTEMTALRRKINSLQAELVSLKNRPESEPQAELAKAEPVKTAKAKNSPAAEPEPAVAEPDNQRQEERAKRAYYDAYLALKNGNYFEASLAFRNFLRDFPGTRLTGEAEYWYGEALLAQGDSDKALLAFQDIMKKDAGTPRHAAAMLKAGLIYEKRKNMEEALSLYNDLIRRHPASFEAETARNRLKQNSKQG